jgi:glycosyltransferase involved in cell wall biosynthesis
MRTSVIIATYNYDRFIGDAIRSVQEQTADDLEIIVIDDGSTDETPAVLAAIRDSRLRVHRIANSGVSVARNTGIALARGQFIAFLDADDLWRPTKLERQLALMESEPELGLTFTNFVRFSEAGFASSTLFDFSPGISDVPSRPSRCGGGRVLTGDTFSGIVTYHLPVWPVTVMLRTAAARDVRFPPGVRVCEDLHFLLRLAHSVQAGYITDPLVEVRRHDRNSYSTMRELMEAGLWVYRELEAEPMSARHRQALRRRIGEALIELSFYHFHTRSPGEAATAALQALRYPGSRVRAVKRLALLPSMPFLADPRRANWNSSSAVTP